MYKLITLLLVVLTLASCSGSKEDKGQKAIQNYLSKTMNDYKSYESVEFGKLDSSYSIYEQNPLYISKITKIAIILNEGNKLVEPSETYGKSDDELTAIVKKATELSKEATALNNQLKEGKVKFKSEFIGYAMIHTFRGKNINGATILNIDTFFLSKDLSKVERVGTVKN